MACLSALPHIETFLVVIDNAIIAEDLAQSIVDVVPHAHIVVVKNIAMAEAAARSAGCVAMAFIVDADANFPGSPLADYLLGQRVRVVLTGDWDADQARHHGWDALPFPFATEHVHALLRSQLASSA